MPGPRTTSGPVRHAVFGVAAGGVLLGHWLTYAVAGPRGSDAGAAMARTGHGYLPMANDLALTLALAGVAVVFLGRLTRRGDTAPSWRVTALRLAVFQIAAFGLMETLERLSAGAPLRDLTGLMPVGIAIQTVLAVLGGLLITWLVRAAAIAESMFGTASTLPRPMAVTPLVVVRAVALARRAVATDGIRGPPPAR